MIEVLIVDDHSLVRRGLRTLLSNEEDIKVVGEAATGKEAIALAEEIEPDIILMDLTMADIDGLEATRRITNTDLESKVLILTVHEDEEYFEEALKAGGVGYILKKAADVELLSAIRAVYQGEAFIYPTMTKILLEEYLAELNKSDEFSSSEQSTKDELKERGGNLVDNYDLLSDREREVFELFARGYTNQDIADKLVISVKTVETHKFRMRKKLKLSKRSEIVRLALQKKIL
ncbi:response regulator transcription factor [Fuchsiella alkaliacetigena]|uniref:response regulator transcription factor n=1 Tax=Fuchsiella alkaliacetigena TaxID=957042 RepID=UPI00200A64F2|nr:response regulator transcription factor [Fuchsiella alkaliacetigena]MCK8825003.1 response regulator transcription factor [Fuchsiella alkaliacetigena]